MNKSAIERLKRICNPKKFEKDEYICHEGHPGSEMYIILSGSVGVYLTSAIGTLTQVATIETGSFFGEMAIFDDLPRSASCIALEDTVAVAVVQDNLQEFLATCPDIAKKMLESMSGRIRKLDDELYKNSRFVKNRHVPKFEIPVQYGMGHKIKGPYQDPKLLVQYKQACPICGKPVKVTDIKRNILQTKKIDLDCRFTYYMCDPIWYEIMSCPHCYYANHYLKFFSINNFEHEIVENLLSNEHKKLMEDKMKKSSDFDILIIKYLQSININEHINPDANALIGSMWRNLYWLSKDSENVEFAKYCADKTLTKFKIALDENEIFDATSRCSTALFIASLLSYLGVSKEIQPYINMAVECPDERIKANALKVKERLEQKLQKNNSQSM